MNSSRNWHCLRSAWFIALFAIAASLMLTACGQAANTSASSTTSTPPTAATSGATIPTVSPSASTNPVEVKIVENDEKYSFSPATLTITKGTKVMWTNASDVPHTIMPDTANAFTASSSNIEENQTYALVFNTAGTYPYHCGIHSYMKATIIVE